MQYLGDRDGKAKTSSAVDAKHYPDMNGREEETKEVEDKRSEKEKAFSHAEIAARAHHIWEQSGRLDGNHEEHWFEAERQLADARHNRTDAKTMAAQAGSVQR